MGYFNPKPERNIFTDIILKWLVDIAVAVAAAVFLILFLGEKTNVIGNSMADKIKSGQTVLIDKMSYELRDIKRFDVVVYRSDLSEDEYIIKRVIRGKMARFIVKNRLTAPEQLSLFEEDGYCFSPKLSTSSRYVFSRL